MRKMFALLALAVMVASCGLELKEEAPQIVYLIGGGNFKATEVEELDNGVKFVDETGRKITWIGSCLITDTPFPPAPAKPQPQE